MHYDVIIIGAGLAGMVAAHAAQAEGVSVLLVDRSGIGIGTNSAMSNGAFSGPTETYGLEEYIKDTIAIGKNLNNPKTVKQVGTEAPEAIASLRQHGVVLKETYGSYTVQPPRPDLIRGVPLVKNLAESLRRLDGVTFLTGFYVTKLLIQDNQVFGISGFDASGNDHTFYAPSVVLATGGAGAIYLRNDNQKSTMGQGYALAAQAGLELWDMEFVQFYPLVLEESGLPQFMVYPPYPQEARLINASGEDIANKHGLDNLNDAIRKMRDSLSALIYSERLSGPVYMDYRFVPEDRWREYPVSLLKKLKFDAKNNPFRVAPGVHYCMGGVRIDEAAETATKGLFASGEVVWGLHGANRRGGNALSECVVFGRISGRSAAKHAKANQEAAPDYSTEKEISSKGGSTEDLRMLRQDIREIAWYHAGIIRTEDTINEGVIKLSTLMKRFENVFPKTVIEKRLKFDLLSASLVLEGILTASQGRHESRGAFIREDFPNTDDTNWRKNSCLRYHNETGEFKVDYHPVVEAAAEL